MAVPTHDEDKGRDLASETTAPDERYSAFEAAWRRGERPAPEAFLPPEPSAPRALPADPLPLDLEYRLKSGDAARVEDCLAAGRFPQLADDNRLLVSLIAAEFQFRQRAALVEVDEYVRRF